jgi:hypothetical protein
VGDVPVRIVPQPDPRIVAPVRTAGQEDAQQPPVFQIVDDLRLSSFFVT